MKIYAATQKGLSHIENEDRLLIGKTILSNGLFTCEMNKGIIAIADGVGGNNAGAVASHFVVSRICETINITESALAHINRDLIEKSKSNTSLEKMATTLSLISVDDKIMLYHVGNTRVYSLQNGKYLKQYTTDDTTVNYLISTGQLTDEEAQNYEYKNQITACFGAGDEKLFKLSTIELSEKNASHFIFTTDGIHDYVSIDDMENILSSEENRLTACEKIIQMACNNDSTDDKSILIGVI